MLRLVIALALGANTDTQAFVISPHHRPALPWRTRGHSSAPVPLDEVPVRSYGAPRRPAPSGFTATSSPKNHRNGNNKDGISMRVRRSGGGDVEIQGAGGETRRIQRRARRRPDLRSLQNMGLQTAAAVLVQQEQGVDVDVAQEEGEEAAQEAMLDDEMGEEYASLAEKYEAAQGLRAKSMMEEEQTGTVLDKYTQIYIPADGIVIKKTYGFWTWQVFGFIFIQHFVRNIIRKGGSLKKTSMSELNWDHIVTEPEHLLELKAYCCEECGYTLFPARGRHEVFFDEVEDFKCPECDAPRSAFYDANDKDDPHNIKRNEALEAKAAGEGGEDTGSDVGGGGSGGGGGGGEAGSVSESAARGGGAPSAVAGAPKPSPSQAAQSASASGPGTPAQAPPESAQKSAAAGESPEGDGRQQNAESGESDGDDDLLDF